ncbi:MAG: ABC transporter substrate-binding protein [Bacteroidetes bacterium CG12_big_fil_rev_8_21_14_0_65_60_17]|nr:MAG: ABC transporter substrate-binding protein [Bacteroidetes bacterium CG12_big_fil_rev_8_21_14_0_65_60_17]
MKRRDFVKKASATAAAGAVLGGCAAVDEGPAAVQTSPRVSWRLASSFPRSLDTIYGAAEVMARRVSALTDDRFRIRVFPAGEIVPYDQVLETVQKGTLQMGHSASYYFTGLNPALAFDATVPFGMNARQLNAWMYYGEGMDLMRSVFADFNIRNYPGGNTGVQMGGWFRRQVDSVQELKGLKMRIPGLGGKVMAELGVNVQVLGGGEIYAALETGTIDATEWSGPYDDEKLGFHQVAKNYYYPGWWEPGPGLSFYINQDAWASLPSTYQAALEAACAEANVDMVASYDAKNPPALERLRQTDITLRPFSEDILEAAEEITRDLQSQEAAARPEYARILESYRAFSDASNAWLGTAENTYNSFAFRSR